MMDEILLLALNRIQFLSDKVYFYSNGECKDSLPRVKYDRKGTEFWVNIIELGGKMYVFTKDWYEEI